MELRLRITNLGVLTALAAILTLACNVPRPLARLVFFDNEPEEQIAFEHELAEDLDATLVSPEGELVGLKPPHGTDWTCVDVAGEVSEMENTVAYYSDTMRLLSADNKIELNYDGEDNLMTVHYLTEFEREMAVIGEDGQIETWNHEVWSNSATSGSMSLWSKGAFGGLLHMKTTTSVTWPQSGTSTLEADYHVIGLVDPMNYRRAFLCNMGRNELPEDLSVLTVENFLSYCPYYYYECTAK